MEILGSYEAYGCKVNAISIDELFRRYQDAGFLYQEKLRRLAPFMPLIRENWTRLQRAGEALQRLVTCERDSGDGWASISAWRSAGAGWMTQHLVGTGGPDASRSVLLAAQAAWIRDLESRACENWFQRSNRFANKVFGTIDHSLGPRTAWVGDYSYFAVSPRKLHPSPPQISCEWADCSTLESIRSLAARARSAVFVAAEGLDHDDITLQEADEMYRKVGLRRHRRVALARIRSRDDLAGVALAYRGPLGLNFSFLENRCDLIVEPALSPAERDAVIRSLLAMVAEFYADFEPGVIPTTVDAADAQIMSALGAEHVRDYAQSAWVREGFEGWYRHVEHIYERVGRAHQRRGLARRLAEARA